MVATLPFLTSYDPPGSSEGSLDPLGLYQIADRLAIHLVPDIRERMQRVRFLTAVAVGALVTEGLEHDPRIRDASPYLVWEWLVVEALIRGKGSDPGNWGVPGTQVGRRALNRQGYLDAKSYLKTPRIFGFYGVYKRLAVRLGLVDVHLAPAPNTEKLVDGWARGLGFQGLRGVQPMIQRWAGAVRRSLAQKPPHTKTGWGSGEWTKLANAFVPWGATGLEKQFLRELLLEVGDNSLGALPAIWELQSEIEDERFREELLHEKLREREPQFAGLLDGIRAYELFARSLQDGFDLLRAEASRSNGLAFEVTQVARQPDFIRAAENLKERFESAHRALSAEVLLSTRLQNLFEDRFRAFSEPLGIADSALALFEHHEKIQAHKAAAGKRPWFDSLGQGRIHIRHAYRVDQAKVQLDRYVHDYRGRPIRRFYKDLS